MVKLHFLTTKINLKLCISSCLNIKKLVEIQLQEAQKHFAGSTNSFSFRPSQFNHFITATARMCRDLAHGPNWCAYVEADILSNPKRYDTLKSDRRFRSQKYLNLSLKIVKTLLKLIFKNVLKMAQTDAEAKLSYFRKNNPDVKNINY